MATKYVVDASSLIHSNKMYPMDRFPTFWKKIESFFTNKLFLSPIQVYDEIINYGDDLSYWAEIHKTMFRENTQDVIDVAISVVASHEKIVNANAQYETADPYVIALTHILQNTLDNNQLQILTQENSRGQNKIPFIAHQKFGINSVNIITFLRNEAILF